mmetsp:Transcript_19367/g.40510  ORF Transcript_19367/g.40510 Transcript_19367/m.40510 type:complete len:215 (-) Transcript_19367:400-1044(-)
MVPIFCRALQSSLKDYAVAWVWPFCVPLIGNRFFAVLCTLLNGFVRIPTSIPTLVPRTTTATTTRLAPTPPPPPPPPRSATIILVRYLVGHRRDASKLISVGAPLRRRDPRDPVCGPEFAHELLIEPRAVERGLRHARVALLRLEYGIVTRLNDHSPRLVESLQPARLVAVWMVHSPPVQRHEILQQVLVPPDRVRVARPLEHRGPTHFAVLLE